VQFVFKLLAKKDYCINTWCEESLTRTEITHGHIYIYTYSGLLFTHTSFASFTCKTGSIFKEMLHIIVCNGCSSSGVIDLRMMARGKY